MIAVVEVCRLPSAPLATTSAAVTAAAPKVRRNEISQKDPRFVASAHVTTTVRPIEKRVGGGERRGSVGDVGSSYRRRRLGLFKILCTHIF